MKPQEIDIKVTLLEICPGLTSTKPTLLACQMETLRGEVIDGLPLPSSEEEQFWAHFRWQQAMTRGFFQGELPKEVTVLLQQAFPNEAEAKTGELGSLGREIASLRWQVFEENGPSPDPYLEFEKEWVNLVFYLLQGEKERCFWSWHRDSPLANSQYQEVLFKTREFGVFLTAVRKMREGASSFIEDIDMAFSSSCQWGIYVGESPRIRTEEEIRQGLG